MRARFVFALSLVGLAACSGLKEAGPSDPGAPVADGGAASEDGGTPPLGRDGAVNVTVDKWVTGRSRPGARSTVGYKPWRSGIAVHGDQVFWG